jgi:hypothetical protein
MNRLLLPGEESRERAIELGLFLLSIVGIVIVGVVIL